jgi:uncharacterized membrane protein YgdD (TMEM256/DUF423 family)
MRLQQWRWLACGAALLGLSAVVLAALGAHAIPLDSPDAERLWNVALQIHMFHAAALLAIAALAAALPARGFAPGWMIMALGTLVFSGSLYLRAAGVLLLPEGLPPIGGLLLLVGWLWLGGVLLWKDAR